MCPSSCLFLPVLVQLATAPVEKTAVPVQEVRRIVAVIVQAAEENAAQTSDRRRGEALFDHYVRRAAAAARNERLSPRAFLIGLGVALDDSDLLRKNLMTRFYLLQMETDAERRRRLRSLGEPLVRNRHDWVMHFAISAALTALFDVEKAERLGVAKEILDAQGDSGFSFADLAADYAGIAFANNLLRPGEEGARQLRTVAESFSGDNMLPPIDDLEDGIPWKRFVEKYGGSKDERFLRHAEDIRRRVQESPGLKRTDP
jgi:hypothetical protein